MKTTKLSLGLLDEEIEIETQEVTEVVTASEEQVIASAPVDQTSTSESDQEVLFDNLDDLDFNSDLRIKIFGIGGAGNNMVNHIAKFTSINKSWLYAINTDYQVLKKMPSGINIILIGRKITKGLGSGSNPDVGKSALLEDEQLIKKALANTDLLFILSGMGKGTGTGASPIIAEIAKQMGILTVSLVNLPSISNEGKKIFEKGFNGLENLKQHTSGILTISNEKLFRETCGNIKLNESFLFANRIIANVINDMIQIVTVPSEINVDFNDVKNFFSEPTNFQVNSFDFSSDENLKEEILAKLSNEIFQDTFKGAKKIIIVFRLNENVTNNFINKMRTALEEITGNKDLELTYAIDYDNNINYAHLTMLCATAEVEDYEVNNITASEVETDQLTNVVIDNELKSVNPRPNPTNNLHDQTAAEFTELKKHIHNTVLDTHKSDNSEKSRSSNEEMTPTKLNRIITKTLQFKVTNRQRPR